MCPTPPPPPPPPPPPIVPYSTPIVSSNPQSPIRPVGSTVTLICTVVLDPAVDVPVTINTAWRGPDGFTAEDCLALPDMGLSTTTYTSRVMVSSFGRNQSGVYTCIYNTTISSESDNAFIITSSMEVSGMERITVGKLLLIFSI